MIKIQREIRLIQNHRDYNIPSSIIKQVYRIISKDIEELNNIINQLDLMRFTEHSTKLQ